MAEASANILVQCKDHDDENWHLNSVQELLHERQHWYLTCRFKLFILGTINHAQNEINSDDDVLAELSLDQFAIIVFYEVVP
jgi:hypothetical protein